MPRLSEFRNAANLIRQAFREGDKAAVEAEVFGSPEDEAFQVFVQHLRPAAF
jgi:hypothetical protein